MFPYFDPNNGTTKHSSTISTNIPKDRHYASLACSSWSRVITLRSVWQELTIRDTTLTSWTYNYGTSRDEVCPTGCLCSPSVVLLLITL